MTKYTVSLAGKQYTVILVTPEDNLSIIGHTKYGWSHLLFPAGYNSDEISLDDLIASCSASFRFYLPNEVYYFPASPKGYKIYKKYCEKHNLIITGGSDFHRELDMKHAYIGSGEFTSPFIENFIEKVKSLWLEERKLKT